jgi:hypothetical protein
MQDSHGTYCGTSSSQNVQRIILSFSRRLFCVKRTKEESSSISTRHKDGWRATSERSENGFIPTKKKNKKMNDKTTQNTNKQIYLLPRIAAGLNDDSSNKAMVRRKKSDKKQKQNSTTTCVYVSVCVPVCVCVRVTVWCAVCYIGMLRA